MRKTKLRLFPLISFALLIGLVGVGFVVINNLDINLDLRRFATGEQLNVTLGGNSSTKVQPNQAFTVDLMINTQGKSVSGVQFSGTISGVDQDKSGVVISQLAGLSPVFSEVVKDGDRLRFKFVELANLGANAFTTHDQNQKIATFNLYPVKSGEVKIAFDQNNSGAMEFGKEFLISSVADKGYNVEITSSVGGGSSSPAPADAGIHRSCNQYCADSRECASEFSCWYNRCRNPKNLTEEKCTDPIVVSPKPIVSQTVVQSKGTPTVSPSPTPITTIATVVITQASTSTQISTSSSGIGSFNLGRTSSPSPSPSFSPTTRNLGGQTSPTPSPVPASSGRSSSSSLGFLIGAAIVTGLLAFGAIIFFLKNRNRNQV